MGLRIGLFLLTNLAIMFIFYIVMAIFNVEQYTDGGSTWTLLFTALFFGFSGSILSLLMSKWTVKRMMNIHLIEKGNFSNNDDKWLYETIEKLANKVNIAMPEVGIYEGEANAFATGPSKNNSLVAISTGLYEKMTYEEIEAVLGHEIGHIANGDMVTQTLLQGVLNTFVIFLARIIGETIDRKVFNNENGNGIAYTIVSFILEIVFSILASLIVMWFSRYREYRADEMGAKLSSKDNMINALKRLGNIETEPLPDKMVSMGIVGGNLAKLFSTHPSIENRIEALLKFK